MNDIASKYLSRIDCYMRTRIRMLSEEVCPQCSERHAQRLFNLSTEFLLDVLYSKLPEVALKNARYAH